MNTFRVAALGAVGAAALALVVACGGADAVTAGAPESEVGPVAGLQARGKQATPPRWDHGPDHAARHHAAWDHDDDNHARDHDEIHRRWREHHEHHPRDEDARP